MAFSTPSGRKQKGSFATPIPQNTKVQPVPPPNGINQVDPLFAFPSQDAVFMYNYISSYYGTRVRSGYREFATNVGTQVKTVAPYNGSTSAKDKLFAMDIAGIYDISAGGAAPTLKLAFPGSTADSGYGVVTNMTVLGGFFLLYCDEEYGYYRYTESTDTWVRTTGAEVTNVNPNNLVGCTVFKSKLWFIEKNTNDLWYLPTGSVIGAATKFSLGNKYKKGGTTQALFTWTLEDTGAGMDEYLVAVSSSGEVLVYHGQDPDVAGNFTGVGSWQIGAIPAGRRMATNFGGELYIVSAYGLQPASRLIQAGVAQTDAIELTRKITPTVKSLVTSTRTSKGWEVRFIPSENALVIMSPQRTGYQATQVVQSLNNQGWSVYQGIPMFTGENWNGLFYFASSNAEGTVYVLDGDVDAQNLAGTSGTPITAAMLGAFSDVGEPGMYHRMQFIRPVFLSSAQPLYTLEARYDYNISETFGTSSPAALSGALWDIAIWDSALWTGDFLEIESNTGAQGMGRAMAVALTTQTTARTIVIRYDAMYDSGGAL